MIRKSKQNRQHSDVHIDQITDAFPHQGPHVTGELLTPFEQDEVECFFGAQVLVYQLFDLPDQLGVLEDRQLDVKDCCFLRPGILFGASSHLLQARTRLIERRTKALDLVGNRLVVDDAVPHIGHFPPEEMHRAIHDPG